MSDVTIISDRAADLVANGGVVNRASQYADPDRPHLGWPSTIEVLSVCQIDGDHDPCDGWNHNGTVRVTDVHEWYVCSQLDSCVNCGGAPVDDCDMHDCCDDCRHACHPDAEPDMWHWRCEATS